MSVYDRCWEREDAHRREALPQSRRIESDIERWARTATAGAQRGPRRTTAAGPQPEPERGAAMPTVLVGLGLVAASLLLFVLVLFVSGALTIAYIPGP